MRKQKLLSSSKVFLLFKAWKVSSNNEQGPKDMAGRSTIPLLSRLITMRHFLNMFAELIWGKYEI